MVSGQAIDTGNFYQSWLSIPTTYGVTPGLMGQPFGPTQGDANLDLTMLMNQWNSGGLVMISDAATNPATHDTSLTFTSQNYVDLLTPGTAINNSFMSELSSLADQLAIL